MEICPDRDFLLYFRRIPAPLEVTLNHSFFKTSDCGQALAFHPVAPYENITYCFPADIQYSHGILEITAAAPGAREVSVQFADKLFVLTPNSDGLWRTSLPSPPGFHYLRFYLNGVPVLSSTLPIGYGDCQPYNFVELGTPPDFCQITDVPHGTVSREYFYSTATMRFESCIVYTPPEYFSSKLSYPVLYLQHGKGENETGWLWQGRVNFILDNLIFSGRCRPMLLVMSDGMLRRKDFENTPAVHIVLYEKMLLDDLIPFIEQRYRILAHKSTRAIAGLSMGSVQASVSGFCHPELFGWIGLFSGFLRNPYVSCEAQKHLKYLEAHSESFQKNAPFLFRAMGANDKFRNRFFSDDSLCDRLHLQCVRKIYSGGHDWNVWRRCMYDFAQLIFS